MAQNWSYVLALSGATLASLLVSYVAFTRRTAPGARPLIILGLAFATWSATYACSYAVPGAAAQFFWLKTTYLGIACIPTSFLIFAYQFASGGQWSKKRVIALLAIEPLLTLVLLWSDPLHHLFFGDFSPQGSIQNGGPWFWFNVIYSYGLMAAGSLCLVQAYLHTPHHLRGQAGALIAGAIFPWIVDIAGNIGFNPFPGLDLTPVSFIISSICFSIGFLRYRLLDIIPIARDTLIENMSDGVIVLDIQNRVVDINKTALEMLEKKGQSVIGESAEVVFSGIHDLFNRFKDTISAREEVVVRNDPPNYFDLHISPLYDRKGHYSGRLIVARDITERRRIEQVEHEQRVLAEILRDTTTKLSTAHNFEEILDHLLDNVGQIVPYDMASFMLLEPNQFARMVRSRGYPDQAAEKLPQTIPLTEMTVINRMVDTRKIVLITDTNKEPECCSSEAFKIVGSYIGSPLQFKGEIIGFLNLISRMPGYYSQEHAERLQAFTDQVGIAVENARLLEEARQRADQASVLLDIGLAVTSGLQMDQLLRALLEQCKRVLPIEAFYIATYDPDTEVAEFPLYYDKGEISRIAPSKISESPGLTGYIILTKKLLYIPDVQVEESNQEYTAIDFGGEPTRSYIGAPLLVGDRVVGVISMQCSTPNAYNPDQIRLLETIATQTAGAIENARLFEEIRLHAEEMTALFDIGMTITSGLDMKQVLDKLLEKCRQVLPVEAFYIGILDEEAGIINHPLAYDRDEYPHIPSRDIRTNPGLSGQVIQNRKTLYIPDITADNAFSTAYVFRTSGTSTRSYVGVPMIVGDHVVGVISMQSYRVDAYDPTQIRLLETIAIQAAVAIENSRLYEKAQAEIRERMNAEVRYRALFEQSQDAVFISDVEGKQLEVNQRAAGLLDYTTDELLLHTLCEISANPEETSTRLAKLQCGVNIPLYETTLIRKDGEKVMVEVNSELVCNDKGEPIHIQSVARDISERKRSENAMKDANKRLRSQLSEIESLQAQLREQAIRDSLTGLYNRRYLEETLMREFQQAERENSTVCLIMLDIDGFKAFNDTHGHDAGDLILKKLGKLLLTEFRASDISCRYGGEEFIIVMPGTSLEKGYERAEHVRKIFLAMDIEHFGTRLLTTLSIGVAVYPRHGRSGEEVLKAVDDALYAAKDAGRNCTRKAT